MIETQIFEFCLCSSIAVRINTGIKPDMQVFKMMLQHLTSKEDIRT